MTLEENKALARRAIDEIWSKGNLAVGPDIYSPNFLSHQHSHPDIGDVRGLSALIEFVREFREAFPDFHDTVDDQVAEGDKVVTRFDCRRKQRSDRNGNRVPSIAHRKLLHKSPPISFVTERPIKLVRVFSRKPRIQRNACDRFLHEILFCRSD